MTMLTITQITLASPFGRLGILFLLARFRSLLNRLVAALIAHQERRAALAALRLPNDRELKGIGLYRGQTARVIERAAQSQIRKSGRT